MAKRKKTKNPTEADLPQNPEFQQFVHFTRRITRVPKSEIDKLAEKERREKVSTGDDEPLGC